MINIKTQKEVETMRKGGQILAKVLEQTIQAVVPGVSEKEIDTLADSLIKKYGGTPGFKMVKGYKNATCISTNSVVVHGVPTDYKFKEGDIVGIDCGVYFEGFHTDMSETVYVSSKKSGGDDAINEFLETGKIALNEAIKMAVPGNRIGNISETIQDIVESGGYSVVRNLIGHGVGRELHEDPEIPGFLDTDLKKTPLLKVGMTLAVEVIYNMGSPDVVYSTEDDWTIKSKDGSLSGLFERTIVVGPKGPQVLTK